MLVLNVPQEVEPYTWSLRSLEKSERHVLTAPGV
jgi:hypothetical protein